MIRSTISPRRLTGQDVRGMFAVHLILAILLIESLPPLKVDFILHPELRLDTVCLPNSGSSSRIQSALILGEFRGQ